MLALLACSTMLAAAGPDAPTPEVAQAYREERARAGRSSADQVRLALWCEAHGLTRERLGHLAQAALSDPANATARGLMGLVAYEGRFLRPEAVTDRARTNPALAEYDQRRMKAPYTAEGQWTMGVWAEERGLKDQARAHFTAVTRLDPAREVAWKRLGYRKKGGRWVTDSQIAAEKAEADAQKQADKLWRPRIDRYRAMLDQPSKRDEAEAGLGAISDPRAVPSIVAAFLAGRHPDPLRAALLLGQVDSAEASRALATLAVFSKAPEVRRAAVETLKRRDPRDFVGFWIGMIRDPIKFEVRPVAGPGSQGTLVVEGPKANLRRVYTPAPPPAIPSLPWAWREVDANGLPVLVTELPGVVNEDWFVDAGSIMRQDAQRERDALALGRSLEAISPDFAKRGLAESLVAGLRDGAASNHVISRRGDPVAINPNGSYNPIQARQLRIPIGEMILESERSAKVARQQLAADVAAIERANADGRRSNEIVLQALVGVTGQDHGEDAAAWQRWWTDHQGYALTAGRTSPAPTIVEDVPIGFTPIATPTIVAGPILGLVSHSCFAAGTAVRTIEGARAIETLRAGDRVLAQDTRTGVLAFQPILSVYHNPPNPTFKVRLGDDAIVVTGIHRFWKAGKGWVMARELKVGDSVRTLGGVARVESVEEDRVQPVFNLEVAEGHSFLVGKLGALVHDNSLVEPALEPFDSPAAVVAGAPR